MNEIYDNDFKNFFKYTKEIKELPPLPKKFDTKHLQDFINEFERVQQENARLKEKIEKAINLLEKHNCENCCDYNNMYALAELKDMKFDERNFELIDKKF